MLDTRCDDLQASLRITEVQPELVGLLLATDADGVGTVDDLCLGAITPQRFGVAVGGLDTGQGVKRRDERHVEFVLEAMTDDTAQPVVAVDDIGSVVAGDPVEDAVSELVGDLGQRLLGKVVRPCRDVDHAVPGFDHDLAGQVVAVGSGERGGLDTRLGQCRAQLAYVHVHAATVAGPRLQ